VNNVDSSLLIWAVILGLIPALIAHRKGYSFGRWWLFGAALFLLALPLAIMQPKNPKLFRTCPDCKGAVPFDAPVCAACGRDERIGGRPGASALPAAGWYPAPSEPGQERWWDGTQWLGNSRPIGS